MFVYAWWRHSTSAVLSFSKVPSLIMYTETQERKNGETSLAPRQGQRARFSRSLTFHFKPGSYFSELNVLMVCFLVGVMPVIKSKILHLYSQSKTHFSRGETLQTVTWKKWSLPGWQTSLHAYCPPLALGKDTWGYLIPVWQSHYNRLNKHIWGKN